MTVSFFFGVLGNVTTGLIYLAPVKTFWHILKRRSTEEFESIPYVFKLLNAYFWTYYGIVKPDSVVVATVNGFGVVVEIIFVAIFLLYAPPRMRYVKNAEENCNTRGHLRCDVPSSRNLSDSIDLGPSDADHCCWPLECCLQHGRLWFTSLCHENSGDYKKRGVHAFPPLLRPVHQWRRLDCLRHPHPGLLHRNTKWDWVRTRNSSDDSVRNVLQAQDQVVVGGGQGGATRRASHRSNLRSSSSSSSGERLTDASIIFIFFWA
ncbi:uncharacterized protein LOC104415615 isoform X1 [Eucalyptus grandis]|uniref:uncharacterized protein LOC104415615 isoform X1 n=1 Tax=Eucalyptus grandis TaxID=71139 RepID=UPI0008A0EB08|nr:uncharacterized protein LOC104415615 isoform X1 [Eucalyptus grandis]